jgi:hypothetical protein
MMTNIARHMPDTRYTAFQYYPFNCVVGFIADEAQADQAVLALREAGFKGQSVGILHGEHGVQVLDRSGKGHGVMGRTLRALQNISDTETALLRRSEWELQNGRFLFRVRTNGSREVMQEVRTILRGFGGYFITFYHGIGTELTDD